jgi:hypothetical protein
MRLRFFFGRVRADPSKENAHLSLPPLEVRAQDWNLLIIMNLVTAKTLHSIFEQQLSLAGLAQVAHPLRQAARRDQVLVVFIRRQVDWRAVLLA